MTSLIMEHLPEHTKLDIERKFVKSTYDEIASDFSRSRYKKWPKVESFLQSLTEYSLLLDVGCGNGKYLDSTNTVNIGCDISSGLLEICKSKNFEVVLGDINQIPFRIGSFDALICIAVLHHIVSIERRKKCLGNLLSLIVKGGLMFVQVWALEQKSNQSKYIKSTKKSLAQDANVDRELKLNEDITLPIHQNRTPFIDQEMLVPFKFKQRGDTEFRESLRYYHLFKEGELESYFEDDPTIDIVDSFYDEGNWCILIKKL